MILLCVGVSVCIVLIVKFLRTWENHIEACHLDPWVVNNMKLFPPRAIPDSTFSQITA